MSKYHCDLANLLVGCLWCDNTAHIERGVWYPTGHVIGMYMLMQAMYMYLQVIDLQTANI